MEIYDYVKIHKKLFNLKINKFIKKYIKNFGLFNIDFN